MFPKLCPPLQHSFPKIPPAKAKTQFCTHLLPVGSSAVIWVDQNLQRIDVSWGGKAFELWLFGRCARLYRSSVLRCETSSVGRCPSGVSWNETVTPCYMKKLILGMCHYFVLLFSLSIVQAQLQWFKRLKLELNLHWCILPSICTYNIIAAIWKFLRRSTRWHGLHATTNKKGKA